MRELVGVARREGIGRLVAVRQRLRARVYEAAGFEARTLEEMELLLAE
jgi:hypothetical protein